MARYLTLGEALLRLKSPGHERLFQSPALEATFGGAEANVAASLARFGLDAGFVSVVPDNALGDGVEAALRGHGVDTRHLLRAGERLGVYFLEAGAGPRPTRVTYDRAGSAFAQAGPGSFDWNAIFAEGRWFHVSGITPALGDASEALALEAVQAARDAELTVSVDLNHRALLWRDDRDPEPVMDALVRHADVLIGGREDCQNALGIDAPGTDADEPDLDAFEELGARVLERYPDLSMVAITLRRSHSATRNDWSACLQDRDGFQASRRYALRDMVDRVGAGDAFAAGLIYGLETLDDAAAALEFATAAGCLKHTVPGDINRVGVEDVNALLHSNGSGRVVR